MALGAYSSNFTITSADSSTITITGVPFTPKIVFVHMIDGNTIGSVGDAEVTLGVAVSTSDEYCVCQVDNDNVGTSSCWRILHNSLLYGLLTSTGARDFEYTFNSFTSDGFVLNVVDVPSSDRLVGYTCYGGSDVTNVAVGTFQPGTSVTTKQITGVGFEGDVIHVIGNSTNIGTVVAADYDLCYGWATGASEEYCVGSHCEHNVGTSNAFRTMHNDAFIVDLQATESVQGEADFTSFNSDGIDYNVSNGFGDDPYFIYAIIKGPRFKAGEFLTQTSTGSFDVTGAGFMPKHIMCIAGLNSSGNSSASGMKFMHGVADGTNQHFIGNTSEDGQATTDADKHQSTAQLLGNYDYSRSKLQEIDWYNWLSDGVQLYQTSAEGTQRRVFYLLAGDSDGKIPLFYHHYQHNIG